MSETILRLMSVVNINDSYLEERYEHVFPFETNNFDLNDLDEKNFKLLFKFKIKALKDLIARGGQIVKDVSPSEERLRMLERSNDFQAQKIKELEKESKELHLALQNNGAHNNNNNDEVVRKQNEEIKQLKEENRVQNQTIKELQQKMGAFEQELRAIKQKQDTMNTS